MPVDAYNGQRDQTLAQIQLLRQNLLHILLSLHRKPAIGHHKMNTTRRLLQHVIGQRFDVLWIVDLKFRNLLHLFCHR